MNKNACLAW